ncbi:substrate-binding domain-containing protein [Bifidobacterium imperatoris]|uniref:Substrate-binding domain-containing protein n=1 Tax=Bifidobacterium imperatoris TaxID=2020965 RepID=A0A2N5IPP2_9BIFI|nr:VWA domain-containing protein [Bifidobacterium imperatoris]PLS23922.1 von Willebrand factor type A (vWA) domain-containing protein [Bifidobacterium imperatoris]QSY58402.1 substrate-binding domain-containing protein [Bifidobacterium imperatoris]
MGIVSSLRRRAAAVAALVCAGALALTGCSINAGLNSNNDSADAANANTQTFTPSSNKSTATLSIASGSENKEVATAIQKAADESNVAITMHYMGSLEIMNALKNGGEDYDAVWPASSMWISMGDTKHIVKDATSTSTTPIVFGIAKSKAIKLGWADDSGKTKPVSTADILSAVSNGDLKFSMTSATQSNSGASAYLAFMTALRGGDQPLSEQDLSNTELKDSVTKLLSGVDRSSGSSDWLKDMVVAKPDRFDSMVNYESLVIQADKTLTKNGHDPLLAIYPSDGIAVSDSPLGYVDRGQKLKDAFDSFAKALSSKDSKLEFERAGRRTGLGGALAYASDSQVQQSFRAEWGINTDASALKTIPLPAASVINSALNVYQTVLRKPSWTVWVVDYSGSMSGEGKDGVVKGLNAALDQNKAKAAYIEPADGDVNILIPFESEAHDPVKATGTNTGKLLNDAQVTEASGGTDIYAGLEAALQQLPSESEASTYTTAIVLMTDGRSMTDNQKAFESAYQSSGRDVPVFSIMFGDADSSQLKSLAKLSNAKVFDGRSGDLASVFRQVKGFN